jgi:hypothetical protein
MQEVREAAGIEIYTVYLQVREDILWGRISDRLKERLRDTMQGANSPGKEYFRKNLGVENVLATIHSPSQSTEKEDREADLEAAALASKEHSLPVVDAANGASEASFRRTSP